MRMRVSLRSGLWIILAFSLANLTAFVVLDRIAPAGKRLAKVKGEDPVNYFGIAHSILFDHDFNLNNEYEHMPPDGRSWTLNQPATGLPGSPWGLGYSFLEIPLLALGTGVDALAGNPADGYSHWAVYIYCIGSVILTGLGLAALFLLLRDVGEFMGITSDNTRSGVALLVALAIFLGTNVGYYSFSEMCHGATFLFANLFLLCWWRSRDTDSWRAWLLLGIVGGFLSICRWQDVLYLGGPVIYDLLSGDRIRRLAWWRNRSLYAAGVGLWWIPQLLEWKAIYGKWLTIPQGGGIFSFPPSHMLQVLFSSQNGWFVWTPITILGVVGLLLGVFRSSRVFAPWIVVLTLQLAVVGSIPFWSGAEAFGSRYMLSNLPLIAVGLVVVFALSGVWLRRGLALACVACCVFTSLFAVQFRLNLVPETTPLTVSELLTDKLRLNQVRKRRQAEKVARQSLANGDPAAAIRILEATFDLGDDRSVDQCLIDASRAAGDKGRTEAAEARYQRLLESRLY
jgi:hypothetical protein